MSEHTSSQHSDSTVSHEEPHVVSMKVLVGVWVALLFLTYITVAATYIDLGQFNLWLALAIATLKASIVALFFMHLAWDKPFNILIFLVSLAFVALFLGLAMMDSLEYQPVLIPGYAPDAPQ